MHPATKLSPATIAIIVQQYTSAEKNVPQLADEYHVSKATISRALNGAGIKPARRDGLFSSREVSEELQNRIIQDYKEGYSSGQLGEMHEVDEDEVDKIIEKAGLKPNPVKSEIITSDPLVITAKPTRSDKVVPIRGVIDPEIVEEFCQDYAKGNVTAYDLASMYNLNPTTVKWYLHKNGFDDVYKPDTAPGVKAGALRAKCKDLTDEIIQIWMDIARDPHESAADRIRAGEKVMERGHGKPKDLQEDDPDAEKPKTQGEKIKKALGSETYDRIMKK